MTQTEIPDWFQPDLLFKAEWLGDHVRCRIADVQSESDVVVVDVLLPGEGFAQNEEWNLHNTLDCFRTGECLFERA